MKLNQTPPPSNPAIKESEDFKAVSHTVVRPYKLQGFVYTSQNGHTPQQKTTDLIIPVGTELDIQRNRDFPGKVWLVGRIEIETPTDKINERLARLIPESDLQYFTQTTQDPDKILSITAQRISESVDN